VAANSERKYLHHLLIRPTTIATGAVENSRRMGSRSLIESFHLLEITNFNALGLLRGYSALDIADDQVT
jgi:hypothetical protein